MRRSSKLRRIGSHRQSDDPLLYNPHDSLEDMNNRCLAGTNGLKLSSKRTVQQATRQADIHNYLRNKLNSSQQKKVISSNRVHRRMVYQGSKFAKCGLIAGLGMDTDRNYDFLKRPNGGRQVQSGKWRLCGSYRQREAIADRSWMLLDGMDVSRPIWEHDDTNVLLSRKEPEQSAELIMQSKASRKERRKWNRWGAVC